MKFFVILCLYIGILFAKPSQEIPTITQSAYEIFEISHITLQNKKGKSYKIHIAKPKKENHHNYATLYLLDGNVFFPILLNLLTHTDKYKYLPIIVGIGHESNLAFDRKLRTLDYTPPLDSKFNKTFTGGGGADAFYSFITGIVVPYIAKNYPTNPKKKAIFGHSFGALFVLHTLLHYPQSFEYYFIASPSLWWGESSFLPKNPAIASSPTAVILMIGEKEELKGEQQINIKQLTTYLQQLMPQNTTLRYVEFSNKTHGSVIAPALFNTIKYLNSQ
ncbi:alpha/beta hydrolase [Helicobacter didelphidarum]|uniref:Alpha/beta hydrolase n=1 Tax=Helicobacter didelphidarum TaxID=2040648 RepID=A0A3D8IQL0_9HELI|nr:alpha/beta hydrolase-fold protein [Helicobacter didelphidarum]RDU67568.1 alpha/beta hydrolase [Helicobacter didelphidarum]